MLTKFLLQRIKGCRGLSWQRVHYCTKWTSGRVRSTFIDFFKSAGHTCVPSSSVIPRKGEGAYFINAGMNQFKPILLGQVEPDTPLGRLKRAVNSQKCIRVGGKHNDLDDVGRDTFHHTFFEMLGSWSFGDYFKEKACRLAWELLTTRYGLPPDRLFVTYFAGDPQLGLPADTETRDVWLQIGVSPDRILPFGSRDNLWAMGDSGPCGPCTEIHYDHVAGRPVQEGSRLVNSGSADLVEIWNLVFMQFDRQDDGSLHPLPHQHVDTGMGLERLTAVLQNTQSNYDTDLFSETFQRIHQELGIPAYNSPEASADLNTAYRLVGDHVRMFTVTIADGLLPGRYEDSQKRLRFIMQRCFRTAVKSLGAPRGFVASLVPCVVNSLGDAYPELRDDPSGIMEVVNSVEERYWRTVGAAKQAVPKAASKHGIKQGQMLPGDAVYELCVGHYGSQLPLQVVQDVASELGLQTDSEAYHSIIAELNSRGGSGEAHPHESLTLEQCDVTRLKQDGVVKTDDSHKYSLLTDPTDLSSTVQCLMLGNGPTNHIEAGGKAGVVLDRTSFYAESGGQVSDVGTLVPADGACMFLVEDVQEFGGYVLHTGTVQRGRLETGQAVTLRPDKSHRLGCARNHTATHLLTTALEGALKVKVTQHGSLVTPERLTFTFRCNKTEALSLEELRDVTERVSHVIESRLPVHTAQARREAVEGVVRRLDSAVYGDSVRVVSVGAPVDDVISGSAPSLVSAELCGGTHVANTGELGAFAITSVTGGQQGIRTVTAVTGELATQALEAGRRVVARLEELQGWYREQVNQQQWPDAIHGIHSELSAAPVMCKLIRDSVLQALEEVRRVSKPATVARYKLRQLITEALVQHSAVQLNVVQHNAVQHSTMQPSAMQHTTVQHSAVQHGAVQYSAVQDNAVQHNAVQHSAVHCSAVQHSASEPLVLGLGREFRVRDAVKVLAALEPDIPVLLLVLASKSCVALCALPQGSNVSCAEWAEYICKLAASDCSHVAGVKGRERMRTVTMPARMYYELRENCELSSKFR